jgi:hypothetical protein
LFPLLQIVEGVLTHTEDNLEHLWHCRFYTPETLADDILKAGCGKFNIVKLRCFFCHQQSIGRIVKTASTFALASGAKFVILLGFPKNQLG